MKKKISIILIILINIFFIGITNCYATETSQTTGRENLENYGVNKHWTITDANKGNVLNTKKVDASEKIYDYSNVLTPEEKGQLKTEIENFINKTNMDMVILIDDFPYTNVSENETHAVDFYDYNDFGLNFENYSGVILYRNSYDADPFYNIHTFGNAQLYYPFERCENILDHIYYDISNHHYYNGFSEFINLMSTDYDMGIPSEMKGYIVNKDGYLEKQYVVPLIPILIISLIITFIIMKIMIKKNKMVVKATNAHEYLDTKSINYTNKEDRYISSHTSSYTVSSSSGGGGGRSSFRGSSGGGHGGGGGRRG